MPITPLHLGPGVLLKSFVGSHLSLMMFALVQIAMDLEVLLRILLKSTRLHGFTNTVLGATVVLIITVPLGKPLCESLLRWWNGKLSPGQAQWLQVGEKITWRAAWIGGILGVYSHLILDAIMHSDARPWVPFSETNSVVDLISIEQLNLLCLVCLLVGGALMGIYRLVNGRGRPGRATETRKEDPSRAT